MHPAQICARHRSLQGILRVIRRDDAPEAVDDRQPPERTALDHDKRMARYTARAAAKLPLFADR